MKKILILLACFIQASFSIFAQEQLPVRGFCIEAPNSDQINRFVKFVDEELSTRNVNVLILRIDYNYQFESHPELSKENGLSKKDITKLVRVCEKNKIRLIPQINLLGHQSWAGKIGKLLQVYPQFDETPHVIMPENHVWPNDDGLYCKSYCPLNPDVHPIVFDLVDEICDVFGSTAFHAGMDEVFYIGEDSCKRCSGFGKATLFANEVNAVRNHLALKNRQLWIWGDRLIDGKTTGIGAWEASMNHTSEAIDLIAKDVMICDWHYNKPFQTPVLFAMKGLSVITCSWNKPDCAVAQVQDMFRFRQKTSFQLKDRYQGMMQTVWSGAKSFMDEFYETNPTEMENESSCFKRLFSEIALAK